MKLFKTKQPRGVVGAGYILTGFSDELRDFILNEYTHANPVYQRLRQFSPWSVESGVIPRHICFAHLIEGRLHVPRGFDPNDLPSSLRKEWDARKWVNGQVSVPAEFPKSSVTPSPEQRALQSAFRRSVKDNTRPAGSYLLVAPTGQGKTLAQCLAAQLTGQKTLVLCLTNQIRESWYGDFKKAFDLSRSDVGLLQAGTWRKGDAFTLCSVRTLGRRRHLWDELYAEFGCVVVDEAHTISDQTLFDFLQNCPAKFIIGMTATERKKTARNYVRAIFGKPVKKLLSTQQATKSSLPLSSVREVRTNFRYAYQPQNLDFNDLLDAMKQDEERNALIVSEVKKDYDVGHSVLVTTRRVEHACLLVDMLREAGMEDANLLTGETNANRKYTESLIRTVFSRQVRCVVAVSAAIKLGANLNPLDRLHVAMPVGDKDDLEQLVGRIRRRSDDNIKKDAAMVYYRDTKVGYLNNVYARVVVPMCRKLKVKGYENLFLA